MVGYVIRICMDTICSMEGTRINRHFLLIRSTAGVVWSVRCFGEEAGDQAATWTRCGMLQKRCRWPGRYRGQDCGKWKVSKMAGKVVSDYIVTHVISWVDWKVDMKWGWITYCNVQYWPRKVSTQWSFRGFPRLARSWGWFPRCVDFLDILLWFSWCWGFNFHEKKSVHLNPFDILAFRLYDCTVHPICYVMRWRNLQRGPFSWNHENSLQYGWGGDQWCGVRAGAEDIFRETKGAGLLV